MHRPLWRAIEARVPAAEREEVREVCGAALVEEGLALFEEADTLAELLEGLQAETARRVDRRRLYMNPARRLLETEVLNLLMNLGRLAPDEVAKDPKRRAVSEYLKADGGGGGPPPRPPSARPGTARSRGSRPSTGHSSSRPSTASVGSGDGSAGSATAVGAQAVGDLRLDVYDLESAKDALQRLLREECDALLEDIDYLQECIHDEADGQHQMAAPPPVTELREMGRDLREELHRHQQQAELEERIGRMLVAEQAKPPSGPGPGRHGRVGKLRSLVGAGREMYGDATG